MPEEGTLSIVRRAHTYQVCYASYHPYAMDRQPYTCTDQAHLGAFLHQIGLEPWYITQACADLRKSGFAVLPVVLSAAQMQVWFPLPPNRSRFVRLESEQPHALPRHRARRGRTRVGRAQDTTAQAGDA